MSYVLDKFWNVPDKAKPIYGIEPYYAPNSNSRIKHSGLKLPFFLDYDELDKSLEKMESLFDDVNASDVGEDHWRIRRLNENFRDPPCIDIKLGDITVIELRTLPDGRIRIPDESLMDLYIRKALAGKHVRYWASKEGIPRTKALERIDALTPFAGMWQGPAVYIGTI